MSVARSTRLNPIVTLADITAQVSAGVGTGVPMTGTITPSQIIGTIPQNKIADLSSTLSAYLTSGSPLDAAKLTGLVQSLIPDLDAAKIITGILLSGRIPGLDASKITTGQFTQSQIQNLTTTLATFLTSASNLNAAKLVGLLAGMIPSLDATKITTGVLGSGQIPNITKAMSADMQSLIDNIVQAMLGNSSTGNAISTVKAGMLAIPGANIASLLLTSRIPGLDASKIISGVINTTQIPGIDSSKLTSGTLNIGRIPGLPAELIITGLFNGGRIPGLDTSKIVSGTFADNFVPGLNTFITAMANSLLGQGEVSKTTEEAAQALAAMAESVAANSAAVATLMASATGKGNSGVFGGEDFEIVAPSNADLSTYGKWAAPIYLKGTAADGRVTISDAHRGSWLPLSNNVVAAYYRRTNPGDYHTKTPYQRIGYVVGASGDTPLLGSTAAIRLCGRASDDGAQYAFVEINGNKQARFGYRNGNNEVYVGTPVSIGIRALGTAFWFDCGVDTSVRTYRLWKNNSVIASWNDTGNMTSATNLGWGFVMEADDKFGGGQLVPDRIEAISVVDNAPTPTLGTFFRAYRNTSTGISRASGDRVLPANCLNVLERISDDFGWDAASQSLVITKAGAYIFTMRIETDGNVAGNEKWDALLYKNAVLVGRSSQAAGVDGVVSNAFRAVSGAFVVYCEVGDVIRPGFGNSNNQTKTIVGDGGGTATWFSATKAGYI